MDMDSTPITDDTSPQLKFFLWYNDISAIQCLLVTRGIKTFVGFQKALEDPIERAILLDKSFGIYHVLGGPFPHLRQQTLKFLFGVNPLTDRSQCEVNQDEQSIFNAFGGCTDHATTLKRSYGSVFHNALMAGYCSEVSESLYLFSRSHELAEASLKLAVEGYAALYFDKKDCPDRRSYETVKSAYRGCRDMIFWCLARVCYGVENREAMMEQLKRASCGVWFAQHLTESF